MVDGQIRDDLLQIDVEPATALDLEGIRSSGLRKRRRRQVAAPAFVALMVVGIGLSLLVRDGRMNPVYVQVLSQEVVNSDDNQSAVTVATPVPTQSSTSTSVNEAVAGSSDAGSGASDDDVVAEPSADADADASDGSDVDDGVDADAGTDASDGSDADDGVGADDGADNGELEPVAELAEPVEPTDTQQDPFVCDVDRSGAIRWTDHGQSKYWIYRSNDDGVSFEWIGRTYGETTFVDKDYQSDYRYELRYDGLGFKAFCDANAALACLISSSGTITWSEHDAGSTSILRSTGGDALSVIGQRDAGTAFTDPDYKPGTRYQIETAVDSPVDCVDVPGFACQVGSTGEVTWADDQQAEYWVYRSTGSGEDYEFIAKVLAVTTFTDQEHQPDYRYQLDYEGLWPRVNCVRSQ